MLIPGRAMSLHTPSFLSCKIIARGFNWAVGYVCGCRRLVELTSEVCVPGEPAQTSFARCSFGFNHQCKDSKCFQEERNG
jgi:hypothetical protein